MAEKKTRHRLRADYNIQLNSLVHPDGKAALERVKENLPDNERYQLVTYALLILERVIKHMGIQATDDLEATLDLLT